MSKSKPRLLFGFTGSIACFKAAASLSGLVQAGVEVQCLATTDALRFIGAATLEGLSGRPLLMDLYESGRMMDHIHLTRWADALVVAPATAHTINSAAAGLGSNALLATLLAWPSSKPRWIAPAMNSEMLKHPTVQESLSRLKSWGWRILESTEGHLACGETGPGRMIESDLLTQTILKILFQTERELRHDTHP